MQASGLRKNQVSQVRVYADQKLRVPSNPMDPSNRRISMIVQYLTADAPPVDLAVGKPGEPGPVASLPASGAGASPAAPGSGKAEKAEPRQPAAEKGSNAQQNAGNEPMPKAGNAALPQKPAAGKMVAGNAVTRLLAKFGKK
jgi:chemotaxis protein MotB